MTVPKASATRPRIVVLATHWGSRHGGINSFNFDFMRSLGSVLQSHALICLVPAASREEVGEAHRSGVSLLSIGGQDERFETDSIPLSANIPSATLIASA
jgi:hypothetical protein